MRPTDKSLAYLAPTVSVALEFANLARTQAGKDIVEVLVLAGLLTTTFGHLDQSPELARQWSRFDARRMPQDRRAISLNRLADYLGIARETIRPRVETLLDRGQVAKREDGLVLRDPPFPGREGAVVMSSALASVDRFIDRLSKANLGGLQNGERLVRPVDTCGWAAIRMATNMILRTSSEVRAAFDIQSPTAQYLFLVLLRSSLEARQPSSGPLERVTAIGLSEDLDLSRETVRRQLNILMEADLVVRHAGGLSVPEEVLFSPAMGNVIKRASASISAMMHRLREIDGLEVSTPAPTPAAVPEPSDSPHRQAAHA
jgi:predicted transcriptional regulator